MSSKIKVLHIIKSLGRGGAEMLLPETLRLHDQTSFEFHYIYFLPWKDQMVNEIKNHGGKVHCIRASNNIQILFRIRGIIQYIKEKHIQIVHCHLPWAGIVGRLAYGVAGVPVLYTEHNTQERYHILTRWMNRLTFNRQHGAIAVSHDVWESIVRNIRPEIPVYEVLNGVNTSLFRRDAEAGKSRRKQLGIPDDAIVVGTIAVFRFQKRLKEWLTVFQSASAKNSRLYGIIVGDGPLKQMIIDHRSNLRLEQRVLMPGLQTDIKSWLSVMDIFMMTSQFEGLPIALLEAMSMQCAVLATDAGGIKEVIRNGKDGLTRSVDQWEMLADDLLMIANDLALRHRLAGCARDRVIGHFGMERMVNELEEIYSRCLLESNEMTLNNPAS